MKSARLYISRIPTRKTKVHVMGPEGLRRLAQN